MTNSDGGHDELNQSGSDSNDEEEQENMETESVVEDYPPKKYHHNLPTVEQVCPSPNGAMEKILKI